MGTRRETAGLWWSQRIVFSWSRRRDSNPEPAVYKTAALPIELRRRAAPYRRKAVGAANDRAESSGRSSVAKARPSTAEVPQSVAGPPGRRSPGSGGGAADSAVVDLRRRRGGDCSLASEAVGAAGSPASASAAVPGAVPAAVAGLGVRERRGFATSVTGAAASAADAGSAAAAGVREWRGFPISVTGPAARSTNAGSAAAAVLERRGFATSVTGGAAASADAGSAAAARVRERRGFGCAVSPAVGSPLRRRIRNDASSSAGDAAAGCSVAAPAPALLGRDPGQRRRAR